jgi:hypothetical protein
MAPPAEGHYPSRRHAGGHRALASRPVRSGVGDLALGIRIAMDVGAAMFVFYFEYRLCRPGDFEPIVSRVIEQAEALCADRPRAAQTLVEVRHM